MSRREVTPPPPGEPTRSGSFASLVERTFGLAYRRPLLSAVVLVVPLLVLAIVVFRPSYDTNDDPVMNLIVAGKVVCDQPDEHMVFTHFFIGLALKQLYLLAPAVPWYGLYLFAAHACAHVAMVYLVLKQRLGWRWLLMYLVYAAVVGLLFLNALQFTTTAFLAAQSGVFLGLFAFVQAASGETRTARQCAIAAAAFLLLAALIRWHVFMMFFGLAVPAACLLAWSYRRQTRLLITAGGLVTLTVAVLVGVAWLNEAYYDRDPGWSGFYRYNELRAQVNDLAWVYYSPETAHVFPQVGWSVTDYAMIQAWFFDDPAVYSAAKLQKLVDAYPWKETSRGGNGIGDLLTALAGDPHVVPLLALFLFIAWSHGRREGGWTVLVLTWFWVCGMLWVTTILRKPPPPRVYLPMLSFPSALALILGDALRGCGLQSKFRLTTILATRFDRHFRAIVRALELRNTRISWLSRHATARRATAVAIVALAAFGATSSLSRQIDRRARIRQRSETFHRELAVLASQPEKLFVGWGASVPFELLAPLDNLQGLSNLHMLQLGWTQQCAFHRDMKRRFGITDLARDLSDRPDIILICEQACLRLMIDYIRQHHERVAPFEQIAPFANVAMFHVPTAEPRVATGERSTQK